MKKNHMLTDRIKHVPELRHFYEFAKPISAAEFRSQKVVNEFEKLSNPSLFANLINYEMTLINSSGTYNPPGANYTAINLIDEIEYTLDLMFVDSVNIGTENKFVSSLKQDYLLLSLTQGGIPYNLYEQQHPIDPSIFDSGKAITLISENANLQYGECILLKKNESLLKYNMIAEQKKVILLTLSAKQPTTFIWTYDLKTLFPHQIVSTIQDSRIENICILLGNFRHPDSVARMKYMLGHPKHNIRWTAFKTLMELDMEEGIKSLDLLLSDTHPEVRQAAQKTKILIETQLTE